MRRVAGRLPPFIPKWTSSRLEPRRQPHTMGRYFRQSGPTFVIVGAAPLTRGSERGRMPRHLILVVALVCIALGLPAAAYSACTTLYFHGQLLDYRNPNCYWGIDQDCSGWNYWVNSALTQLETPNDGQTYQSWNHPSGIRGAFRNDACCAWLLSPADVGWSGWYLRSAATYWSGRNRTVEARACN